MYEIKNAFADISKIIKHCEQSELASFVYKDSVLSIQFSKVVQEEVFYVSKKGGVDDYAYDIKFDNLGTDIEKVEELDFLKEKVIPDEKTVDIVSPYVGTVFFSNQIKSAFGDITVNKGDVICSIEAMKIYNDIKAPTAGIIVQILVEDCSLVEFEQPIFRIMADKVERK